MARITILGLEREIEQSYAAVREAWELRNFFAWSMLSAWLAGSRLRLMLMRRGWIK